MGHSWDTEQKAPETRSPPMPTSSLRLSWLTSSTSTTQYVVAQSCTPKQKSRDQDFVDFTYIGRVPNGTVFGEAGVETGGPIHIEIGMTGLKGWDKALAGMCKGDKKRAFL